jgi:hypothetical protein
MQVSKLKRYLDLFLGLFPRPLPIGQTELNNFFANIFGLYVIPDLPSYRLAISTMILHMGPQEAYKSPFWFYRSIRAAQAKEVAYQVVADDREARNLVDRQQKQAAAEAKVASAAAQPAVTIPVSEVTPSVQAPTA